MGLLERAMSRYYSRSVQNFATKLMRVQTIAGTLLLTPFLLAQGVAQKPVPNLELRLLPGEMVNGVPQAFTFELINVTHHNVWVANPAVQCDDTYDGYISLQLKFTPLDPPASETGGGCAGDRFDWPPILVRAQEWKLLPPGERIEKTAPRAELHYEVGQAGTYEFWAEYYPAAVRPAEQQALRERGIDFPIGKLTTSHLTFKTSH
jgi:hypothetical protein